MLFTRRHILSMTAAGLCVPRLAFSRPASSGERKFLFIYLWGGADQTTVLYPTMDHSVIPDEALATSVTMGDLRFVDHPDRPSVYSFFDAYADRAAFLHGMEIRSIAHERCRQLVLTGSPDPSVDDWPAMIAGASGSDLLFPCLVHSGPSYTTEYTDIVVRLGETGQLSQLLDGTALTSRFDPAQDIPEPSISAAVDAYVAGEASKALARAGVGRESLVTDAYSRAMERLIDTKSMAADLELTGPEGGTSLTSTTLTDRVQPLLHCLEMGLCRTAMIEYRGADDGGFDTHFANSRQSEHHEDLFARLIEIVDDMAVRPGQAGGSLLDETCVVVFTEMGRQPILNHVEGKDHWTVASAMLVGGGINGGRTYGGYTEEFQGAPTDLGSGDVHSSGVSLQTAHFGATLLAMGGVDPGPLIPDGEPITALFE